MQLTCAVGTQPSQQLKSDVPLHTHGTSVDLEDVSAPLRERENRGVHGMKEVMTPACSCLCPQHRQMENNCAFAAQLWFLMCGLELLSAHDTKVRK